VNAVNVLFVFIGGSGRPGPRGSTGASGERGLPGPTGQAGVIGQPGFTGQFFLRSQIKYHPKYDADSAHTH